MAIPTSVIMDIMYLDATNGKRTLARRKAIKHIQTNPV
jgi:hypothetical protein